MIKKLHFIFLLIVLVPMFSLAQINFAIKPSATVIGKDDVLQVSYEIDGTDDGENFQPPIFLKWKLISGPNFSSEQIISNGKAQKKVSYIFLLQPSTTGDLVLPETSISINNKTYTAKSISITVKKEAHVAGAPTPSNSLQLPGNILKEDMMSDDELDKTSILKPGENIPQKIKNNIFVKANISKTSCYVGEPILVTYKLYTRLHSQSKVTKQPAFSGCTVYEMPDENNGMPQIEKINGKNFKVYIIRKLQLVPLQAGKLILDNAAIENEITFFANEREMLYGQGSQQTVILKSDAVSLQVNALPTNKQSKDSNIAIGKFSIATKVLKTIDTAGDNNNLQIIINGEGNFQNITLPLIDWPNNIEHFDYTSKDDINKTAFPFTGTKTFSISFVSKEKGVIIIPKISFTYFDAAAKKYSTVQSDSIKIDVAIALKNNIDETKISTNTSNRKYVLIFVVIALLAGFILWWIYGKKNNEPKTVLQSEPKELIIEEADNQKNFQELLNDLLTAEHEKLFFAKAKELLLAFVIANPSKKEVAAIIINKCDEALYSPVTEINKEEIFEQIEELIN